MTEEDKLIMRKFHCWSHLDGNRVPCPNDPRKGAENSIHSSLRTIHSYGGVVLACMDCGFATDEIPQEILDADDSRYEQSIKDMQDKIDRVRAGTEPRPKPLFTEEQKKSVRDKILGLKAKE